MASPGPSTAGASPAPPAPFRFTVPGKRKPPTDNGPAKKRPSLASSFTRRIAFLIEQLNAAGPNAGNSGSSSAGSGSGARSVDALIGQLRKADPSLKRKPDKVLREAVEAALNSGEPVVGASDGEALSDDSEAELDVPSGDAGFMNRSLLGLYNRSAPPPGETEAVEVDGEASPSASRLVDLDGENGPVGDDNVAEPAAASGASSAGPGKRPSSKEPPKDGPRNPKKAKMGGASAKKSTDLAAKYPPPSIRLRDMGGIDALVPEILRVILLPFAHSEIHTHLGITPPRGVLLHGPPGCGKTMLAGAIAGELGVPFVSVSAPSVVGGMSGESEKRIREIFDEAKVCSKAISGIA